jgi:nicotinamidase/pyrazinamidase
MTNVLIVVDLQNDFTEGGSLGVKGGNVTAASITAHIRAHKSRYSRVIASRDWHSPDGDNGGHFAVKPDMVTTWPRHCVQGTIGSAYNPALELELIDIQIYKGDGQPAYSAFEGKTPGGASLDDVLRKVKAKHLDIVGIASDHCVRATALDAIARGYTVTVLVDLCVGVAPATTIAAVAEMTAAGVDIRFSE